MTDIDGWVAFVGAGPGDDGLLTMRAVRLLGTAGLVVADAELAERVQHLLPAEAQVAEPADAAGTAKALAAAAKAGQLAVRLYPGDPLLSGASAEIAGVREGEGAVRDRPRGARPPPACPRTRGSR